MAEVLVTGGTGVLGSVLVSLLRDAGHGVRVLSRRPGAGRLVGDLATGAGVAPAVDGCDAVVHAASAPLRDTWSVDVHGTRRLAVACREAGVAHLVDVSIVAVDRLPYSYYRAKYAAEEVVAASRVPCSVVRAAQFHPLVAVVLSRLHRGPVLPVPRRWRLQPVAVRDVAAHLVHRLTEGPLGGVEDCVGPQTWAIEDLGRTWLAAAGLRARVLPVPVPGRLGRALRSGDNLVASAAVRGRTSWGEWLATQAAGARSAAEWPEPSQYLRRDVHSG